MPEVCGPLVLVLLLPRLLFGHCCLVALDELHFPGMIPLLQSDFPVKIHLFQLAKLVRQRPNSIEIGIPDLSLLSGCLQYIECPFAYHRNHPPKHPIKHYSCGFCITRVADQDFEVPPEAYDVC